MGIDRLRGLKKFAYADVTVGSEVPSGAGDSQIVHIGWGGVFRNSSKWKSTPQYIIDATETEFCICKLGDAQASDVYILRYVFALCHLPGQKYHKGEQL